MRGLNFSRYDISICAGRDISCRLRQIGAACAAKGGAGPLSIINLGTVSRANNLPEV
jgi:hypothetical protein